MDSRTRSSASHLLRPSSTPAVQAASATTNTEYLPSSLSLKLESSCIHPDLRKERKICSFSIDRMAIALFGKDIDAYGKMRKLLSHNPCFDARDLWWISGSERYLRACRQAEEFVRVVRQNKLMDTPEYMLCLMLMAGEDFFIHVHLAMFLPTIQNLADEEQQADWLPPARDFTILGTYAQTELGHGSNVAGLETTADFDYETDEWVLNTPTITATKWWAGGLGKSCTHCVLMARLRIGTKDYGVHAFFLQIRDLSTHESLRGVVLRHLGQKLGYNGMDNGTMQLHSVRIPRRHLFMRFCSVDRKGVYERRGHQKLLYATMTFSRKQIIMNAGAQLAKCVTIATRYSVVRRQFVSPSEMLPEDLSELNKLPEAPVLDYSTQQRTLFPLMATSVAYWFTAFKTDRLYRDIMAECNSLDFSRLSDIHAITSSLKATMTGVVVEGIEACRKACGGHGFALASGIPLHLTTYIPQATYEGDFVVLAIQAGRILLKTVEQKMKGDVVERQDELSTKYLFDFDPFAKYSPPEGDVDFRDPLWQLHVYKQRSCALTFKAAQSFATAMSQGMNMLQALDEVKVELTHVTIAFASVIILKNFMEEVENAASFDPEVQKMLHTMLSLYALHWIEHDFGQFVVCRAVSSDHFEGITQVIKELLKEMRPNAIGMTDAFGFPDYLLNSALGRYDGRVYEALFKATLLEPLNRYDVSEGYYRHLQYVIHPDRKSPDMSKL